MFAGLSIQNAKLLSVIAYPELDSAPLILRFEAMKGASWGDFTIHTNNVALTVALAAAINGVLKQFEDAAAVQEPPQPVDDGSCDPLFGQRMDSADMGEN